RFFLDGNEPYPHFSILHLRRVSVVQPIVEHIIGEASDKEDNGELKACFIA
ncbi:hypothetical protein ACLOJK_025957, partial [Asimina triloba]